MHPPHTVCVMSRPFLCCIYFTPKWIVKKYNAYVICSLGQEWIVSFPTEEEMNTFVADAQRHGFECSYLVQLPSSNPDIIAGIHDQAFYIAD